VYRTSSFNFKEGDCTYVIVMSFLSLMVKGECMGNGRFCALRSGIHAYFFFLFLFHVKGVAFVAGFFINAFSVGGWDGVRGV